MSTSPSAHEHPSAEASSPYLRRASLREPDQSPLASAPPSSVAYSPPATARRRGAGWLIFLVVLVAAGIGGKYYFEADALKSAAVEERRTAEQVMQVADREIAAATAQVRKAVEQAAQSDVQAREAAKVNAREIERIRTENMKEMERIRAEMETTRRESVAKARREAEEEGLSRVTPQVEAARATANRALLNLAFAASGADPQFNRGFEQSPRMVEGLNLSRSPKLPEAPQSSERRIQATEAPVQNSRSQPAEAIAPVKAEPARGAVVVSSSPEHVEFSIRSFDAPPVAEPLYRGRTPAHLKELPAGDYVVAFKLPGFPERSERMMIERGLTASVAATFPGGSVSIQSSPSGATVMQNGLVLGRTPLVLGNVPAREMTYELTADGHEPLKVSGAVAAGGRLELKGTLLKLDRLASEDEVRTPPRIYFSVPLNLGRVPRSTPPNLTISFVVQLDGTPHNIRVLERLDKKVEQRAIEAFAKWRFFPGVSHAGYPVHVRMSMPVPIARG
jgi:hypothetical protein